MLILTRKLGQSLILNENIEVSIAEISGDKVKIAISAPKEVSILRKELFDVMVENRASANVSLVQAEALKGIIKLKK